MTTIGDDAALARVRAWAIERVEAAVSIAGQATMPRISFAPERTRITLPSKREGTMSMSYRAASDVVAIDERFWFTDTTGDVLDPSRIDEEFTRAFEGCVLHELGHRRDRWLSRGARWIGALAVAVPAAIGMAFTDLAHMPDAGGPFLAAAFLVVIVGLVACIPFLRWMEWRADDFMIAVDADRAEVCLALLNRVGQLSKADQGTWMTVHPPIDRRAQRARARAEHKRKLADTTGVVSGSEDTATHHARSPRIDSPRERN